MRTVFVLALMASAAHGEMFVIDSINASISLHWRLVPRPAIGQMQVEVDANRIRLVRTSIGNNDAIAIAGSGDWFDFPLGGGEIRVTGPAYSYVTIPGVAEFAEPFPNPPSTGFGANVDAEGHVELKQTWGGLQFGPHIDQQFEDLMIDGWIDNPDPDFPQLPVYRYELNGEPIDRIGASAHFPDIILGDPLLPGDANLDGQFNADDLIEAFSHGYYDRGIPDDCPNCVLLTSWRQGDWNGDDLFNSDDLILAFAEGNYASAPAAVPEPSSALLAALAILALARCGRPR